MFSCNNVVGGRIWNKNDGSYIKPLSFDVSIYAGKAVDLVADSILGEIAGTIIF